MCLVVLDQILAQKYNQKIKIFKLWSFTQQQNINKKEIRPSLPSVMRLKGFKTKY